MSPRLPNPKICAKCGRRGKVDDSRALCSVAAQRRHHVCKCGHTWNSYEYLIAPQLLLELLEGQVGGRQTITLNTPGRTVVRKP